MTNDEIFRWLDRLAKETAGVRGKEASVVAWMRLAEVRFHHGLSGEATEALARSLGEFDCLKPVRWAVVVERAADLCERLDANHLLEPEAERGAAWRTQPKIVQVQTGLPHAARRIALQSGRSDLVGEPAPHDPLDADSRRLVDGCRVAGWMRNARELKRSLGPAIAAIDSTDVAAVHRRQHFRQLAFACLNARLFDEAATIVRAGEFPFPETDETLIALRKAQKRKAYVALREDWLNRAMQRLSNDAAYVHWRSSEIRRCISTTRALGDSAYRDAVVRFRGVVESWQPRIDRNGCAVRCDLAVLEFEAGSPAEAASQFDRAQRYFEGREPDVPTAHGNKTLMASMLSAAYRDVGDTVAALKFARKLNQAGDRTQHILSAALRAGRVEEVDKELAKLRTAEARADAIGSALMSRFSVGCSAEFLLTNGA